MFKSIEYGDWRWGDAHKVRSIHNAVLAIISECIIQMQGKLWFAAFHLLSIFPRYQICSSPLETSDGESVLSYGISSDKPAL